MVVDEPDKGRVWSVGRVLRWTAEHFATHGIDSPRLTAELLLAHCLGVSRLHLYLRFDQPLNVEERDAFRESIRRRIRREPVAYILGERSFWTLDLEAGPEALIPRPDTETLVTEALALLSPGMPARILDLGTGTGCIALALAAERPLCRVLALDLSFAACRLARRNALKAGVAERVSVVTADWCSALKPEAVFDLVLSNPPYIPTAHIGALAPEVRDHEPPLALDGGADGLAAYRILARSVREILRCGGWLLVEIGYDQAAQVTAIFREAGGYGAFACKQDLAGKDRVLAMRRL